MKIEYENTMNKIVFYFAVSVGFVWVQGACNPKENMSALDKAPVVAQKIVHDGDTLIVSDYALIKEKVDLPLSSFVSSLNVVVLDNSDEALMAADGIVTVSENYIGLSSYSARAYKLFDKKGNYLHTITRVGQGPDEYPMALYDSYMDEKNRRIYILPVRAQKILVFDLEGNPQQPIPLAYLTHKGRMMVDAENEKITILALPFEDTPSVVWEQDFNGSIRQEIPAGDFVIAPGDYSNELGDLFNACYVDFSTFYLDNRKDSLYHYHPAANKLQPVFTMQFEKEDRLDLYGELPGYYLVMLYALPGHEEVEYPEILIDKKTLRGAFVRFKLDVLGNIDPAPSHSFSRGYFISLFTADELREELRKVLTHPGDLSHEMIENMKKLEGRLMNDEDLVMVTGKLKDK